VEITVLVAENDCLFWQIEKYSHHITITPAKQMLLSQLELDHAIK
jgi:hypothetical protein